MKHRAEGGGGQKLSSLVRSKDAHRPQEDGKKRSTERENCSSGKRPYHINYKPVVKRGGDGV